MDRNDYYGGESASLNLTQMNKKFGPDAKALESHRDRDFNVDLVPKFMMANGEIVRFLTHTGVTRYLEFKQISGSFVYKDGKVFRVPASETEAVTSSLLGLMEKRRVQKFFEFIQNWQEIDPSTHEGLDLDKNTMSEVYDKFGLEVDAREFIGHAMALHLDDEYLNQPARETVDKIILYVGSVARYGKSPYIYPLYGLGELPQSFARLSAIFGGTYMLDKPVTEIVYENGVAIGVRSEDVVAKAKSIICDPSYAQEKVKKIGSTVRAICFLDHPIEGTGDANSSQIVIPQKQVGRKHDIYVASVSSTHNVCPKDMFLAIVSTIVETDDPEQEIAPGLQLLGKIRNKFISISSLEDPLDDGTDSNVFISRSYDATSHFETVCDDVKSLYKRVTGNDLVLKQRATLEQSD
ncbi:Rab GDP dissociation inhibitor alpha [Umbelopsis sp. WA50703]